ncbi:hypothetical protein TWF281_001345 [Arthrobotrys megalospora]
MSSLPSKTPTLLLPASPYKLLLPPKPFRHDITTLTSVLQNITEFATAIQSYCTSIVPTAQDLLDLGTPPSIASERIYTKIQEENTKLSTELKYFLRIFPGLGCFVYDIIPVHIVGWLYAVGTAEEKYKKLVIGRTKLLVGLEVLVRRDVPIYLGEFIEYFGITSVMKREGGMFGDIPKGQLMNVAQRVVEVVEEIGGCEGMEGLKREVEGNVGEVRRVVGGFERDPEAGFFLPPGKGKGSGDMEGLENLQHESGTSGVLKDPEYESGLSGGLKESLPLPPPMSMDLEPAEVEKTKQEEKSDKRPISDKISRFKNQLFDNELKMSNKKRGLSLRDHFSRSSGSMSITGGVLKSINNNKSSEFEVDKAGARKQWAAIFGKRSPMPSTLGAMMGQDSLGQGSLGQGSLGQGGGTSSSQGNMGTKDWGLGKSKDVDVKKLLSSIAMTSITLTTKANESGDGAEDITWADPEEYEEEDLYMESPAALRYKKRKVMEEEKKEEGK